MSEGNQPDVIPNKLPHMRTDDVKARAQALLDVYGVPPYPPERLFLDHSEINPDHPAKEAQKQASLVIGEFVHYWLPFLKQK